MKEVKPLGTTSQKAKETWANPDIRAKRVAAITAAKQAKKNGTSIQAQATPQENQTPIQ